jgi:AcrR family transcriptional regulator
MPRQPDPDLEERILKAAHALWHKGGDEALTLRAVARAAGTNTPAVYRRFKDRRDLVRGLLLRTVGRIRGIFEAGKTIEEMAEAYIDLALEEPHEYELFYRHAHELSPRKGTGRPRPIRELRPNFALLEQRLAQRLGGLPEDHSQMALALWALLHGTTDLLLSKAIPEGHEEELRSAVRAAVQALLNEKNKSRFLDFAESPKKRAIPLRSE